MRTFDTTPPPDFLEAYRRVTGSDDTTPTAVFAAVLDDATAFEISCAYNSILREREEARTNPLGECPACGAEISTPRNNNEIFRCHDCGVELVREVRLLRD